MVERVLEYEFLPKLAKASFGMSFGHLMRGDATKAKRYIQKLFHGKSQSKVSSVGEGRDQGLGVMKTSEVRVYGKMF